MIKEMTVNDLITMLQALKTQKMVKGTTKIQMSCDEEGNHFSPMAMIDGKYNVAVPDEDDDKLTLYPL